MPALKDAIDWVKDALAAKDILQHFTCYYVAEGRIWATNGRLVACHPFPYTGEPFLVSGEDLGRLVNAAKGDPSLVVTPQTVRVESGKFKGTLKKVDASQWPFKAMDFPAAGWAPADEEFIQCLKLLRPFVSENATQPWATCIGFAPGWAFATNNVAVARYPLPGNTHTVLFPEWAVDFVLSRTLGLKEWSGDPQSLFFRWENGAWLRALAVNETFPPTAGAIIEKQRPEDDAPQHEITPEYREVFERVIGLLPEKGGDLCVTGEKVLGEAGDLLLEEEIESTIKEGVVTRWHPKVLLNVLKEADHWCPWQYPAPVYWRGEGDIEGVLLGKRQ